MASADVDGEVELDDDTVVDVLVDELPEGESAMVVLVADPESDAFRDEVVGATTVVDVEEELDVEVELDVDDASGVVDDVEDVVVTGIAEAGSITWFSTTDTPAHATPVAAVTPNNQRRRSPNRFMGSLSQRVSFGRVKTALNEC